MKNANTTSEENLIKQIDKNTLMKKSVTEAKLDVVDKKAKNVKPTSERKTDDKNFVKKSEPKISVPLKKEVAKKTEVAKKVEVAKKTEIAKESENNKKEESKTESLSTSEISTKDKIRSSEVNKVL